jgi:hypothetical protein
MAAASTAYIVFLLVFAGLTPSALSSDPILGTADGGAFAVAGHLHFGLGRARRLRRLRA